MAVSRVQSVVSSKGTTGTSVVVTIAAATAGNLLVGWFNGDSTTATPTGFTLGPSIVDGNGAYIFWKVAVGGETSVTFGSLAAGSPCDCGVVEYTGTPATTPNDGQNSSTIANTAGTTTTAASVTTTGAGLVFALAALHAGAAGTPHATAPTWTNSFINFITANPTQSGETSANFTDAFGAELVTTGAGTYSTACSWTSQHTDRQQLVLAIKAAGVAASPTRPLAGTARLQAVNRAAVI